MQAVPKRILSDELAVHTEGLVQRYGRETVLSGVDLTVPEGPSTCWLGRTARERRRS